MAALAAASSMAALTGARISSPRPRSSLLAPPRSLSASSFFSDARRFSSLRMRANSSEDPSGFNEFLSDLKEKWDSIENKSSVFLYVGGAVVVVWISSVLVGAIDNLPLIPKIMELVGFVYTGWFIYHYLLFKSGRKELANDIDNLKKKITGTDE